MRWVKPLCGAVAEIQSLNILCIQPLHMVAWQFVQYTPPGETKKKQRILGAPSLTIHHQFGGARPLAFWSGLFAQISVNTMHFQGCRFGAKAWIVTILRSSELGTICGGLLVSEDVFRGQICNLEVELVLLQYDIQL